MNAMTGLADCAGRLRGSGPGASTVSRWVTVISIAEEPLHPSPGRGAVPPPRTTSCHETGSRIRRRGAGRRSWPRRWTTSSGPVARASLVFFRSGHRAMAQGGRAAICACLAKRDAGPRATLTSACAVATLAHPGVADRRVAREWGAVVDGWHVVLRAAGLWLCSVSGASRDFARGASALAGTRSYHGAVRLPS